MNEIKKTVSIELPLTTYEAMEQLAREQGVSIAALMTDMADRQAQIMAESRAFFAARKCDPDIKAALEILNRPNTLPPHEGDELPEGWSQDG